MWGGGYSGIASWAQPGSARRRGDFSLTLPWSAPGPVLCVLPCVSLICSLTLFMAPLHLLPDNDTLPFFPGNREIQDTQDSSNSTTSELGFASALFGASGRDATIETIEMNDLKMEKKGNQQDGGDAMNQDMQGLSEDDDEPERVVSMSNAELRASASNPWNVSRV